MALTQETRQEIAAVLGQQFHLAPQYQTFLVKWMAFNRAYNELGLASNTDREKVLEYARGQEDMWDALSDFARNLVSLECIGSERVAGNELLQPHRYVKSATFYLREQLGLDKCPLKVCRPPKKQTLCASVPEVPWTGRKVAALLRLVYQVRCNLVHGDKMLMGRNPQTNRDYKLVRISEDVLDIVLASLLEK